MSRYSAGARLLCAFTSFMFAWNALSLSAIAFAQTDPPAPQTSPASPAQAGGDDYATACADGERAANERSAFGYGIGGFLIGVFGFAIAEISSPKPPAASLAGKSSNYAMSYSQCYEKKAHSSNVKAACGGWAAGAAVALAILAATSSGSNSRY